MIELVVIIIVVILLRAAGIDLWKYFRAFLIGCIIFIVALSIFGALLGMFFPNIVPFPAW